MPTVVWNNINDIKGNCCNGKIFWLWLKVSLFWHMQNGTNTKKRDFFWVKSQSQGNWSQENWFQGYWSASSFILVLWMYLLLGYVWYDWNEIWVIKISVIVQIYNRYMKNFKLNINPKAYALYYNINHIQLASNTKSTVSYIIIITFTVVFANAFKM